MTTLRGIDKATEVQIAFKRRRHTMSDEGHIRIDANYLLEVTENEFFWESRDHVWRSDALVRGPFLEALVRLAAQAPGHEKRAFLRKFRLLKGTLNSVK